MIYKKVVNTVEEIIHNEDLVNLIKGVTPQEKVYDCKERIIVASAQEFLISQYYPQFKIVKTNKDEDLLNGDFRCALVNIDLKVANTTSYISSISRRSIDNYDRNGLYLCFNKDFTKYAVFTHKWLDKMIDMHYVDFTKSAEGDFIKGGAIERLLIKYGSVAETYKNF